MHSGVHHALATTWKRESARIVAAAARRVHDLGVAEEVAQDALVAALEHWPRDGIPQNPAAWLMTTALNRALDYLRRLKTAAAGQAAVAQADHRQDVVPRPQPEDLPGRTPPGRRRRGLQAGHREEVQEAV
ncbi:MAG: hypothetical protein KC656_38180, partial [Myxococcales bacterium]|nr:hypothetical protein [Myxococcales bacterium]